MIPFRTEITVASMIWLPTLSKSLFVSSRILIFDTDSPSVSTWISTIAPGAAPETTGTAQGSPVTRGCVR